MIQNARVSHWPLSILAWVAYDVIKKQPWYLREEAALLQEQGRPPGHRGSGVHKAFPNYPNIASPSLCVTQFNSSAQQDPL